MVDSSSLKSILMGFVGAAFALGIAIWGIGFSNILSALSSADPTILLVTVFVAICWLTAWGMSLRAVLAILGAPITIPATVAVYTGATFANNVTPLGHAGGEPVSAFLISKVSKSEYETGLAAIASVDTLNFVPSVMLGLLGLGYFATTITFGTNLTLAAAAVVGFALVLPIAVYVGWHNRYRLERGAVDTLTPSIRKVAEILPRQSPPEQDALERRIEEFFTAIERVATNPRGLVVALVFSALGWLSLAVSLWLSLFALGYTVSPAVVLVAIPAGAMAGITPLPGGLGGVGLVLGALVTATTSIPLAAVAAAVIIHRGATYVLPTAAGGGIAGVLVNR